MAPSNCYAALSASAYKAALADPTPAKKAAYAKAAKKERQIDLARKFSELNLTLAPIGAISTENNSQRPKHASRSVIFFCTKEGSDPI